MDDSEQSAETCKQLAKEKFGEEKDFEEFDEFVDKFKELFKLYKKDPIKYKFESEAGKDFLEVAKEGCMM